MTFCLFFSSSDIFSDIFGVIRTYRSPFISVIIIVAFGNVIGERKLPPRSIEFSQKRLNFFSKQFEGNEGIWTVINKSNQIRNVFIIFPPRPTKFRLCRSAPSRGQRQFSAIISETERISRHSLAIQIHDIFLPIDLCTQNIF